MRLPGSSAVPTRRPRLGLPPQSAHVRLSNWATTCSVAQNAGMPRGKLVVPVVLVAVGLSGLMAPTVQADSVNLVTTWGGNPYGELGNSTNANSRVPVAVTSSGVLDGLTIEAISAGPYHACVLSTTQRAYCWGDDTAGQLGDGGSLSDANQPVAVAMPSGVEFRQVSAGSSLVCAVSTAGAGYCWGEGTTGAMGDGTRTSTNAAPVAVTMPTGITFSSISAGNQFACAVATSGAGYCWGSGANGQTGLGNTSVVDVPTAVSGGPTFQAISAGLSTTTCGLDTAGAAYCWGYGGTGELGNGTQSIEQTSPVAVDTTGGRPTTYAQISTGGDHVCALTSSGVAWCWGGNSDGQLGDGSTTSQTRPVAVTMPAGVTFTAIDAGLGFTCAVGSDTRGYCWGANTLGELGIGSAATSSTTPVAVVNTGALAQTRLSDVAAGSTFAMALASQAPDAPTSVVATAGQQQASVTWTAPSSNGGSTITGYTVTSSPDGRTCSWTSGPLDCTVTGLTAGTAYTFTVTATNDAGTSVASSPSTAVTPTAPSGGGSSGGGSTSPPTAAPTPTATPSSTDSAAPVTTDAAATPVRTPVFLPAAFSTPRRVTPAQLRALTPQQLGLVSGYALRRMPYATLRALTPEQARSLTRAQMRELSPKQRRLVLTIRRR